MNKLENIVIKVLEEKDLEDGALRASFELQPFPRGFGHTLGNSLRRVLLSSIPGYAITNVRINDLDHEFSTIPGVLENVLDIVLRLQKIRFRVLGSANEYTVRLNAQGVKEVRAKDFETPSDVEVVNGEYVIANLTDKSASLNIEATLERNIGFKIANDESRNEEPGLIPIDAVFSPVKLVDYDVVSTRKGEKANLDKVVITIETDGSVTPKDALFTAIEILRDFYDNLYSVVSGNSNAPEKEIDVQETIARSNNKQNLDADISILDISDNLKQNLMASGIKTIQDLVEKSEKELRTLKGVGPRTLEKLIKALESLGYTLK